MDIAPFRGLRYNLAQLESTGATAASLTAPPYDVLSPTEHRALLDGSEHNITRLTLGEEPGGTSAYADRGACLGSWVESGAMVEDVQPGMYVYSISYPLPGAPAGEANRHFLGLVALGKQHPFSDGVVLPHEETFPKVVDDRLKLLDATRTHLESIFLLYADPDRKIDTHLETAANGPAAIRVEAKPGEVHSLHPVSDPEVLAELRKLFAPQRPIIADGHHRYTMGHRYRSEMGANVPGSDWQLMTFANLYSDGLAILATHRLAKLNGLSDEDAFARILPQLETVEDDSWDLSIESRARTVRVRFPAGLRAAAGGGAAATDYALLQNLILGEWLGEHVAEDGVSYYKEGTGESEALAAGDGDLLFRMQPVGREEFQRVVQGGEVYPHKTTYFYPKLWSGLVLWRLAEV